jgi:Ca2+-binding EF-hand superfamily protein
VQELKNTFESNGNEKEERLWEDIMQEVDEDNDGMINFTEFISIMEKIATKDH